ncbi:uncharacterized protein LOC107364289 [Tetranychus urticae]|uniref:BHLH domain-containing protein n=1 Tax=Tetranychus urticae TaxID=32264 RepID=T1KHY3_TETUR|nr:uncharacterized protein LOC107364289 [Tetranychus urticae]XP_015787112.1 uncharacterized protein LOC107364289 [Tetranychus urticae]
MSLETLLEAARYLSRVEQDAAFSEIWSEEGQSSNGDSGGHLLIDPNLPISCQFHTYSSAATASKPLAFPVKNSKKTHSSQNDYNGITISPVLPSSLSSQSSNLSSSPTSNSYRRRALSTGSSSSSVKAQRGNRSSRYSESSHDADSAASNRHREMHKTSEKNRRAQLRDCFEQLKKELPQPEYRDRKSSHINIINCALRCIQNLKKKEAENEIEMARLARTKVRHQNTISQLRQDLKLGNSIDVDKILKESVDNVPVVGAFEVTGNEMSGSSSASDSYSMVKTPSTYRGECDGDYQSDGEVIAIIANNLLNKFSF